MNIQTSHTKQRMLKKEFPDSIIYCFLAVFEVLIEGLISTLCIEHVPSIIILIPFS